MKYFDSFGKSQEKELDFENKREKQAEWENHEITKDPVVAAAELEISSPAKITSIITTSSADELNLKVGDSVNAIVKSNKVMIGKD